MANDVKSYVQRVASRLSEAFDFDEFGTDEELYFWSLLTEIASRKHPPTFKELVQTVDLIFGASVHCAYRGGVGEQLTLFRQMVQPENINRVYEATKGEGVAAKDKKQFKIEFQEQLQTLDSQLNWSDDFRISGNLRMNFGECFQFPLYDGEELWGIYVVGPYVSCPERMQPKLSIVGRMLAQWLEKMRVEEHQAAHWYHESVEKEFGGGTGTGSLNTESLLKLYLGHLGGQLNSLGVAVMGIRKSDGEVELLSEYQMPEPVLQLIKDPERGREIEERQQMSLQDSEVRDEEHFISQLKAHRLREDLLGRNWYLVAAFSSEADEEPLDVNNNSGRLFDALGDVLDYRKTHAQFSEKLIDDYEALIRFLEKKSGGTYWHTERVKAFALKLAEPLHLDDQEQDDLLAAARLHDVGYAAGRILQSIDRMGLDLEHPQLSYDLINDLPLSDEVKDGVLSHHEWIDGSGSPNGVTGEEIPWIGKLLGLAEFIVEFVERSQSGEQVEDSGEEDQRINELTEALVERADQQFDIVLVPHAVEALKNLGWTGCLKLGTEEE